MSTTATSPTVRHDVRGVPVTTSDRAGVELLERAIIGMLGHRADTGLSLQAALAHDPLLVPALCMQGFAYKCLGRRDFASSAWASLHAARSAVATRGASERERGLARALECWCLDQPLAASEALSQVLASHPRDVLAFKMHHALNFILGRSHAMLEASTRASSALDPQHPGYGYVLGCHAFALEETGSLREAEACGRHAIESEPLDAWGAHAVAHVLETEDRPREGVTFMDAVEAPLLGCNNFAGHLAWHRGLFLLQLGEFEQALELYDTRIAVHLGRDYRDVCNASTLLVRLQQEGCAVGDRWERLSELARERMGDHGLGFADAHYVLSLAGSGDTATAARYVESMRGNLPPGYYGNVTEQIGVPLSQGIVALFQQRPTAALQALLPLRRSLLRLGGSNAQRDIFAVLLIEAALAADRPHLAHSLLNERLRQRPNNRWALSRCERLSARPREPRVSHSLPSSTTARVAA